MYKAIMVPVDVAHMDKLDKALTTAADLAAHYKGTATLVAVTANPPDEFGRTFEEFAANLEKLAAEEGKKRGVTFASKAVTTPDPRRELDDVLKAQAHALGADLIIMGSHVPHFAEYIISSNAGYLASHVDTSVFIVR